jgi:hypothetical protein
MANNHKTYQMAVKYTKVSISRPSKLYQKLVFWYRNKPSGNPAPIADLLQEATIARDNFDEHNFERFLNFQPQRQRYNRLERITKQNKIFFVFQTY